MSKRNLPSIDPNLLKQAAKDKRNRARHAREGRHSLKFLTSRLGIAEPALRNWLTRGALPDLDAERGRDGKGNRLFSNRDVVAIAAAYELSRVGVPPAAFGPALKQVLRVADYYLGGVVVAKTASTADNPFGNKWVAVFREGPRWRAALIIEGQGVIPPESKLPEAYALLHIGDLMKRALEAIGMIIFGGTAEEMRTKADALKEAQKGPAK